MFTYHSHGLNILSEIEFPEFSSSKINNNLIDVIIRYGKLEPLDPLTFREVHLSEVTKAYLKSNTIHLFWNEIELCIINEGKEIIINDQIIIDQSLIKLFIIGYAMGMLLHQRGRLVLHANAVNMGNEAILFTGSRGKGKSTTTFAMHKKGHKLISDDILSLEFNKKIPVVIPGFPGIKLWPDTLRNMGEYPEVIPKIHLDSEKRFYYTHKDFSHSKIPLKAIYSIESSEKTIIEDLNPHKSIIELIRSSYCYLLFNKKELFKNLEQCGYIVNNTPVKRLKIKRSYDNVDDIIKKIEEDLFY